VLVEIFGIAAPNICLKATLPRCYNFVERLGCRCKIIGLIIALLMIIHMYLGHQLMIFFYPCLRFHLCLPGPVTVKVEIVIIASSAGPRFAVFAALRIGINGSSNHTIKPVNVTVAAIGIEAGIDDNDCIF